MSLVFIPVNDYKNIGGPTTFIKNLTKYFDTLKIDYSSDDHNISQSILFPISYKTKILKIYKRLHRPIIQRLDGMTPSPWKGHNIKENFFTKGPYDNDWVGPKRQAKFFLDTMNIHHIYKHYSDIVIFQSQYCRDLCFDVMGPLDENRYEIIPNGVHCDIFYPNIKLDISSLPSFVMSGRFRRKDMLLPVLDALDLLKVKYDFRLKIIGPLEDKTVREEAHKRDYVDYKGPLSLLEISKELRNSDIYIFASLNAPCPNALLEAVSVGLPIVSYDYGSVSELLYFGRDLIAEVKKSPNPLIKFGRHLSAEALMEKLELALNQYNHYKKMALSHCRDYSFEKCGDSYLKTIRHVIK